MKAILCLEKLRKINQKENIKYNICFQEQNKRKKNEEESNKATY